VQILTLKALQRLLSRPLTAQSQGLKSLASTNVQILTLKALQRLRERSPENKTGPGLGNLNLPPGPSPADDRHLRDPRREIEKDRRESEKGVAVAKAGRRGEACIGALKSGVAGP
jgi:hypothetical protein